MSYARKQFSCRNFAFNSKTLGSSLPVAVATAPFFSSLGGQLPRAVGLEETVSSDTSPHSRTTTTDHANYRIRGDYASYPIEVITELPRSKQTRGERGGAGGRRRRPYGDTGITMVDDGCLPPASAFRDAGNRSLFRFEQRPNGGGGGGGDAPADNIVEATLRLARESNNRAALAAGRSAATAAAAGVKDLTFLTSVERQQEEDHGAASATDGNASGQGRGEVGATAGVDLGRWLDQEAGGRGRVSTRLLRGPIDPMVRGDPVKLRMALTALRHTLKHPVASSMDVRKQQQNLASRKDCGVGRKTAAARARQLPRRPYRLLKGPHQEGFCAGLLDGLKKAGSGGSRDSALGRVDEVLTSMGAGMDEMVLEKQAEKNKSGALPGRPELLAIIRTVNAVLDENEY